MPARPVAGRRPDTRRVTPSANRALVALDDRLVRSQRVDVLGERSVEEAGVTFRSLCEWLAVVESRGFLAPEHAEQIWVDSFAARLRGWR